MPDYQQHERFGVHYLRPTSVLTAQLYQQIGQLKVERDFLSRSFGL